MKQMVKIIAVLIAPLLISGCLFLPGKFDANLKLTKGQKYEFTYVGEMQIFAGNEKDFSPPKLVPFNAKYAKCSDRISKNGNKRSTKRYDRYQAERALENENTDSVAVAVIAAEEAADAAGDRLPKKLKRACTDKELAELEKQQTDRYDRRKKEYDERSAGLANMFGGAIPGNDGSLKRFAKTLMKYDGWEKVEYAGNNLFNVEYRASGKFDRYFAFPVLNDASMQYPFFHIVPRKSGELEVMTPAISSPNSFMGMAVFGKGFGRGGQPEMPNEVAGTFTIETNGEILANNSADGFQEKGKMKVISWQVENLAESPRALIRLK